MFKFKPIPEAINQNMRPFCLFIAHHREFCVLFSFFLLYFRARIYFGLKTFKCNADTLFVLSFLCHCSIKFIRSMNFYAEIATYIKAILLSRKCRSVHVPKKKNASQTGCQRRENTACTRVYRFYWNIMEYNNTSILSVWCIQRERPARATQ